MCEVCEETGRTGHPTPHDLRGSIDFLLQPVSVAQRPLTSRYARVGGVKRTSLHKCAYRCTPGRGDFSCRSFSMYMEKSRGVDPVRVSNSCLDHGTEPAKRCDVRPPTQVVLMLQLAGTDHSNLAQEIRLRIDGPRPQHPHPLLSPLSYRTGENDLARPHELPQLISGLVSRDSPLRVSCSAGSLEPFGWGSTAQLGFH